MSLGSPHSQAVDDAVNAALTHVSYYGIAVICIPIHGSFYCMQNIPVVASAGNSYCDACMSSPASAAKTTSSSVDKIMDSQLSLPCIQPVAV